MRDGLPAEAGSGKHGPMTPRCLIRALLLSACLTSCSAPPTPSPQTQAQTAPTQASGIDGVYRGSSTRFQADSRNCPHPGLLDLAVQAGRFEYRWSPLVYVDSMIGPDGSVQGTGADVTLSGHLDGDTLSGDVTNGSCGLHFTTTRQN